MLVQFIMNKTPSCCTPATPLQEVARIMVEENCGSVPVISSESERLLIGIVTDRDIVCRTIAKGQNPLDATVSTCMSKPVVAVRPDFTVEDCMAIMEQNQIRRVPVIDANGRVAGIVTQAHVAANTSQEKAGEMLRSVSKPTGTPSKVGRVR